MLDRSSNQPRGFPTGTQNPADPLANFQRSSPVRDPLGNFRGSPNRTEGNSFQTSFERERTRQTTNVQNQGYSSQPLEQLQKSASRSPIRGQASESESLAWKPDRTQANAYLLNQRANNSCREEARSRDTYRQPRQEETYDRNSYGRGQKMEPSRNLPHDNSGAYYSHGRKANDDQMSLLMHSTNRVGNYLANRAKSEGAGISTDFDSIKRQFRKKLEDDLSTVQNKKKSLLWINTGLLLLVILMFVLNTYLLNNSSQVIFCKSFGQEGEDQPDCSPCPSMGLCADGRLVSCDHFYKLRGNLCVVQDEDLELVNQMYNTALGVLRRHKGEIECKKLNASPNIDLDRVKDFLRKSYQGYEDFEMSFRSVENRFQSPNNPDVEFSGFSVKATSSQYSMVCNVQLFYQNYKYLLILLFIVFCFFFFLLTRVNADLKNRAEAKKILGFSQSILKESSNGALLEEKLKYAIGREFNLSREQMSVIYPYVYKEAQASPDIELLEKIEDGIKKNIWWLHPKY